jgi:transcriptional regulator with XRE-family HTH domain
MDTSPLGQRIRAERERLGLTQEQAARRADLMLNTYQRAEGGKIEPRLKTLRALATLFGLTIDELVGDDNEDEAA